jgi:hypothetical protein
MQHNNCVDCGAVILKKAVRCRPCNFIERRRRNSELIRFKCPVCHNICYIFDRGDVKNGQRVTCSKNCAKAKLSQPVTIDPAERNIFARARHNARGYIYKFNIKPADVSPELFTLLVRSYVAKIKMKGESL